MNLVADGGVDRPVVQRLRDDGHDVTYIGELSPGVTDDDVLRQPNDRGALLLTASQMRRRWELSQTCFENITRTPRRFQRHLARADPHSSDVSTRVSPRSRMPQIANFERARPRGCPLLLDRDRVHTHRRGAATQLLRTEIFEGVALESVEVLSASSETRNWRSRSRVAC